MHGDPGKRLFIHEQTKVFRSRSIEMLVQKSFSMNAWAVGSRADQQQSTIFLVAHLFLVAPFPGTSATQTGVVTLCRAS